MTTPITARSVSLAQIVAARKVLTAIEARNRKAKRSLAVVRALHGVLDEETLRLAFAEGGWVRPRPPLVWDMTTKDSASTTFRRGGVVKAEALIGDRGGCEVVWPRELLTPPPPPPVCPPWWRSGEIVTFALTILGVLAVVVYLAIRLPV